MFGRFVLFETKLLLKNTHSKIIQYNQLINFTMFEDFDWRKMLLDVVVYAGKDPWNFIFYVLLCLSPFFLTSAYLSWYLVKQIDSEEKEKKKKMKKDANLAKIKRQKAE